jgi:hypothetical protein
MCHVLHDTKYSLGYCLWEILFSFCSGESEDSEYDPAVLWHNTSEIKSMNYMFKGISMCGNFWQYRRENNVY